MRYSAAVCNSSSERSRLLLYAAAISGKSVVITEIGDELHLVE